MKKIISTTIFILIFCIFVSGQDSNCPTILITGPVAIPKEGENITFSAQVDEKAKDLNLEYIWSVKGKITEGQGTPTITAKWDTNASLTITVEIKGLPEGCENTVTETFIADPAPQAKFIDEFSFSGSRINAAKFDKINTALKDDSAVYIIIYNDKKTSSAKVEQKEQQIRKIIREKNIPRDRIIIVRGGEKENLIRFWLVPAGATPPTP